MGCDGSTRRPGIDARAVSFEAEFGAESPFWVHERGYGMVCLELDGAPISAQLKHELERRTSEWTLGDTSRAHAERGFELFLRAKEELADQVDLEWTHEYDE